MELIVDFPQATRRHSYPSYTMKREVSFSNTIDIVFVGNIANEHKADLFYSAKDIHSFKHQTSQILRSMLAEGSLARYEETMTKCQDTAMFLGLESCLTKSTYHESRLCRKVCTKAVVTEARRQMILGIDDPQAIARLSELATERSRMRARTIALFHACER